MKNLSFDNTYVTVDMDVIAANFRAIAQKAGVPVMAIIKADAYGHGAIALARELEGSCAFFGVSSVLEALELRKAGIRTPILNLGQIPTAAFAAAIREGIRPAIFRYEDACELSRVAVELGIEAPFHLAVDTGMSRIGFQITEQDADICAQISRLPGIAAEGIFSHFATADSDDLTRASRQAERFDAFCKMLEKRGVKIPFRHLDNSAGIVNFEKHYDMARAGIILYGLYPSEAVDIRSIGLKPALEWTSRVTHVKTLEAGREIGYGGTYTTTEPTVVATVPVGYADGYKRTLSNKFYVLIRGQKAPILGRICMDQMMVDVTHIPGVETGDKVVLIGKDGDRQITAEQIGEAAQSFNYEFVCGISRRVPRYYRKNGEIVHQVHYLLDHFA